MQNTANTPNASVPAGKRKISSIVWSVISVILILLIAIVLIGKFSDVHIIPFSPLWVLTGSMEPTIPAQSYILIQYIDASEVKKDDIITYRDDSLGGDLNTHRVIEVIGENEAFLTRGDANYTDDPIVTADKVVAKHIMNLSVLTFLGQAFTSLAGLAIVIICLIVGCTLWTVLYVKRQKAAQNRERIDRLVAEEVAKLEAQKQNAPNEDDKRTKTS